jgi:transposase
VAINYIVKLYAIEKQAEDTSSEARRQLRQEKSVLILNALREWLDKTLHSTLPKGLQGTALGYLNKNWEKLIRYTENSGVNIDNNLAENALRRFVIGRLLSATPRGAHASAAIYSLFETTKANGLGPYAYLREVFTKLTRISDDEELQALLPWNVSLV